MTNPLGPSGIAWGSTRAARSLLSLITTRLSITLTNDSCTRHRQVLLSYTVRSCLSSQKIIHTKRSLLFLSRASFLNIQRFRTITRNFVTQLFVVLLSLQS